MHKKNLNVFIANSRDGAGREKNGEFCFFLSGLIRLHFLKMGDKESLLLDSKPYMYVYMCVCIKKGG